jgi:hypothetical protein
MNSLQLRIALLESIRINVAVCAKDQLVEIKMDSFAIIVNTQSSTESGMHWVAFYKQSASSPLEFFDSFGLLVDAYGSEFVAFAARYGRNVIVNLLQLQPNHASSCAQFCLYFLINRNFGRTYKEISLDFNPFDKPYNDILVREFVKFNFRFPKFQKCLPFCKQRCIQDGIDLSSVYIQFNTSCFRLSQS